MKMDSLLLPRVAVLVLFGLTSGLKSSEESGTWNELEKAETALLGSYLIVITTVHVRALSMLLLSYSCGWMGELGSLGKASALQYIKLCFQRFPIPKLCIHHSFYKTWLFKTLSHA